MEIKRRRNNKGGGRKGCRGGKRRIGAVPCESELKGVNNAIKSRIGREGKD